MTQLIRVRDCMATKLVTLPPDMEVMRAVHVLSERDISGAPVVEPAGDLIGMFTQRDCMGVVLNAAYHGEYAGLVKDYMATKIEVMAPEDELVEAARRFHTQRYLRYPVLDDGRLVGQISRTDVIRAMCRYWPWRP